jgi:predicted nucleic acid-binding protein
MRSELTYIYWDSCVFLSYVSAIAERIEVLDALLDQIQHDRRRKLITSSISIAEVAFASGHGRPERRPSHIEDRIDELWDASFVELVEVNRPILYRARTLMRDGLDQGLRLKPYDAVHLATASWINANIGPVDEIHTYDGDFRAFEKLIGIRIVEPYINQPPLLKEK